MAQTIKVELISFQLLRSHRLDKKNPVDAARVDFSEVLRLILKLERVGAGEGNRTLVCSLEDCRSTIELRPPVFATVKAYRQLPPCQLTLAVGSAD